MKLDNIYQSFCIEEHQAIYDKIMSGDYNGAIVILETIDEMANNAIITEIYNRMKQLLKHIIKLEVQNPTSSSWHNTIQNQIDDIFNINKRHSAGGYYLNNDELLQQLNRAYSHAIRNAAHEMTNKRTGLIHDKHGNKYQPEKLATKIIQNNIINTAMTKISTS